MKLFLFLYFFSVQTLVHFSSFTVYYIGNSDNSN